MGVTTPKHFNIKFCQKLSTLKSFRLKFFMVNESTITRTLFLKVKTIPNNQTIFFFKGHIPNKLKCMIETFRYYNLQFMVG